MSEKGESVAMGQPMGQPMDQPMGQPVIFKQPQSVLQRATPDNMKTGQYAECPPGLEYLAHVDQLLIKQQIELVEILSGCEMNNKYRIYNTMGQQVFYAAEDTECCMRICCGPMRGFTIHITDNQNQEIMTLTRPFKCCHGCFCCAPGCGLEMSIEAPPGNVIGYVGQMQSCIHPMLSIFDDTHEQIAQIRSPHCCCMFVCPCQSCNEREFSVATMDDREFRAENRIAICSKQWSGIIEAFTDTDYFNLRFPMDMGPKLKATLLGAVLMIDFFFYEKQQNN